jgi:hypothetical protein
VSRRHRFYSSAQMALAYVCGAIFGIALAVFVVYMVSSAGVQR